MDKGKVLRKNKAVVSRLIAGETILVPLSRSSNATNCIYTLNGPAGRVWELLDGKRTLEAVVNTLAEEFDSERRDIEKEVQKLVKELSDIKACR